MFSLDARGSLKDSITYAKLRKTNYVKTHFKPANPQSNAQIGTRAMSKFLTQNWKNLSTSQKALFEPIASELNTSAYHAYLKFNQQRWNAHLLPISDLSKSNSPGPFGGNIVLSNTGRRHDITYSIFDDFDYPFSCQCCFSTSPGFTPLRSNTKTILDTPSVAGSDYTFSGSWTAPDDQTYYLKTRYAFESGNAIIFRGPGGF